ncbi:hypothetical protein BDZ85DRAFT_261058 [Elsinoe ampelina]|uniref:Uncharacterized protein n=1 Tax=Elsinoe ampelina TaxID=302913 RepID=A0A6A6GFU2_9PEZI|nr:hypothetical protein BDZ85DRAFT_261058 [Elsinoe ampelina]
MDRGRVVLYDTLGGQIHDTAVDVDSPIIGLEWVQGVTPNAIGEFDMVPRRLKHESVFMTESGEEIENVPPPKQSDTAADIIPRRPSKRRSSGVVAALTMPETRSSREEIGELYDHDIAGTVVHSPPSSDQPARLQVGGGRDFADFFSPGRQGRSDGQRRYDAHSPMRSPPRPRIRSNTFVDRQGYYDVANQYSSHVSTSSQASEPAELDPNLTLSYLNAPTATDRNLPTRLRQDKTVFITPDYMITSSSDHTLDSSHQEQSSIQLVRSEVSTTSPIPFQTHDRVSTQTRRHAHPSPAKPKRRSQQRPSFTAYMNRTAASGLRRRSAGKINDRQFDATTLTGASTDSLAEEWVTSGSETEKATSTLPTGQPTTRRIDTMAQSDLLANVPRKDSVKKPALGIISPETIYYDTPTYPQTRKPGGLLESLRRDRPKTTLKAITSSSFMPSDPAKMPLPAPIRPPPPPPNGPEIMITPPQPERQGSRKRTHINAASKKSTGQPSEVPAIVPKRPLSLNGATEDYFQQKSSTERMPRLPGNFPMSTTSEEAYTASEWQDGDLLDENGNLCPPSKAIRQLCPRGSSLAPASPRIVDDQKTKKGMQNRAQKRPHGLEKSPMSKFHPAMKTAADHTHIPGEFESSGTTAEESRRLQHAMAHSGRPTKRQGETNWAALSEGLPLLDKRRNGIVRRRSSRKDMHQPDAAPPTDLQVQSPRAVPRKSKFTEGQIDGLTEAIVDAIKRASEVSVVPLTRDVDTMARNSGKQERLDWTSMSSGLTPSPLRIIRYYEDDTSPEQTGHLTPPTQHLTPHGKSHFSEMADTSVHQDAYRPGRHPPDRLSLDGTQVDERQHTASVKSGVCECCKALRDEISTLREEIMGLRADLTGYSIVLTDIGHGREEQSEKFVDRQDVRRAGRRAEDPVEVRTVGIVQGEVDQQMGKSRRGNDLHSFSETR